jgi:DNA-directed RNA polymerase subunit M/transcription elongation factor TFIIS
MRKNQVPNASLLELHLFESTFDAPDRYVNQATLILYDMQAGKTLENGHVDQVIPPQHPLYVEWIQKENEYNKTQALLEQLTSEKDDDTATSEAMIRMRIRCLMCGSTDVEIECKQTRSIDEPMTIFCACKNPSCKKTWRNRC